MEEFKNIPIKGTTTNQAIRSDFRIEQMGDASWCWCTLSFSRSSFSFSFSVGTQQLDDRTQSGNPVFVPFPLRSKVPNGNGPVSASCAQQIGMGRVPSHTLDCTCMATKYVSNRLRRDASDARRLISRASRQECVVQVPFRVKDPILVRLERRARRFCVSRSAEAYIALYILFTRIPVFAP